MNGIDVKKIWMNLRVKGNRVECEQFDFLSRPNRIFNHLVISMFDSEVKKECDGWEWRIVCMNSLNAVN